MVILRCVGPDRFFLERVVFPFELLSFACPPLSEVKIWTHGLGGPELLETIQAEELQLEPPPGGAHLEAIAGSGAGPIDALGVPWAEAG